MRTMIFSPGYLPHKLLWILNSQNSPGNDVGSQKTLHPSLLFPLHWIGMSASTGTPVWMSRTLRYCWKSMQSHSQQYHGQVSFLGSLWRVWYVRIWTRNVCSLLVWVPAVLSCGSSWGRHVLLSPPDLLILGQPCSPGVSPWVVGACALLHWLTETYCTVHL